MQRFNLGTLILTPVNDLLPREEILARYSDLYVLFGNKDDEGNINVINIGKPHARQYDMIGSNCWGLEQHEVIKYFTPIKDGEIEYNSNKPIFKIKSSNSMTVETSDTLVGETSLDEYMTNLTRVKRAKLVASIKTIVPITKEEKDIYDSEGWETYTLKDQDGIVDFANNDNDINSCYFGVVGEKRINLFKTKDPDRPILRLYTSYDGKEVLASTPIWNTTSINEVISGRYGFNKVEEVDNVKKIG